MKRTRPASDSPDWRKKPQRSRAPKEIQPGAPALAPGPIDHPTKDREERRSAMEFIEDD